MDRPGSLPEEETPPAKEERRQPARRYGDQLYRSLVETLNQGIYVADARNRFTYCNPAMCAIGDYKPEDLLGTICFRHIVREDRLEVMRKVAVWAADPAVSEAMCEFRVLAREGKMLWVEQSTRFIRDDAGRVIEAHNTLRDISARRASEEALRASERHFRELVENINQGFYIADARSLFTYSNPAMSLISGFTAEELRGTSSFRLVAAEDRQRLVARYIQWADSPATSDTVEFRAVTKSGEKIWLEQVTQIVRAPDRRVVEFRCFLTNISERRASQMALRESEERFRSVFDKSPFTIALLSVPEGRIVEVNAAAEATFGYKFAELRGRTSVDLGLWADAGDRERYLDTLRAEGHAPTFEARMRRRDGEIFTALYSGSLVSIGGRQYSLNTIQDISARKAAETALRDSEQQFKGLFDESPIPIILLDAAGGKIREVNKAAMETFGYKREEVLGKTSLELGAWPDPAERETLIRLLQTRGWVRDLETTMRGADGRLVHVLFNSSQITLHGQPCLLNSIIDITNLKRAEQLFHDLFAFSPDASFIADSAGAITDVNERMLALFGYQRAEIIGRDWSFLFPEEARASLRERSRRYFENPVPISMGKASPTLIARAKDGRTFPIDVSLTPLKSGGEVRIVTAIRDITLQLKTAEDLQRSEAQLRQAQKMESLGTLAGGIAHDFNNILTGILGHAQLALEDLDAEHPARAWMAGILSSGVRAKNLVQQILTFSRKAESTRHSLRLQQVTSETIGLLRSTIPAMVRIEPFIDPACPPVLADGTQIHQVILNLCTNAWHALPETGGRIVVGLARRTLTAPEAEKLMPLTAGDYVVLSVEDNGRGMEPATQERIFEPFFTTKDSGKGTGLGLAVVHSIVAAHGGAIAVHSQLGAGSLFEVFLPALPDAEPAAPSSQQTVVRGRGEHVLVVDDEPNSGQVISMVIERLGYQTTYSDNPAAALELLAHGDYAMLVTDLAMPGMTGDVLARQALARRPDLPILLLSGFLAPGKQEALRALGVREVLGKPPSYDELATALQRCLRK